MKPFFSIIIPCSDVEPYVRECFASVTGQSFRDWECLIGIEPSKDQTEEVINELVQGDGRFRIFHGPHSGSCSASRNTGIDMARGEYVIFLDGDDTIEKESLARIAEKINANPGADLYPCAIVAYIDGTDEREIRDNYTDASPAEMTGVEATLELDRLWHGGYCPMLQLTVFRREFLIENGLKCIYGLRRQDSEFSPRALYRAKRVVPLREPFYLYRIRPNSVSNASKDVGRFHKDFAIIFKSLLSFYATVSREPDFDVHVAPCWTRQWLSRILYVWFYPYNVRNIARERRLETLGMLFSDGFADFDSLLKFANRPKRIAGRWLKCFIRHPWSRRCVEILFRFYYAFTESRGRRKRAFHKVVSGNGRISNL
jgi:glycosyltransferase involved in cell wall biosynthesis